MKKQLEKLIELQEIDTRLNEIEDLKGDLPDKVKSLATQIETLKTNNETSKSRVEEIAKDSRTAIQTIEDGTTKLKKYKEQLYLVTSNKEYDALLKEIDAVKSVILEAETTQAGLITEKTNLEDSIKENELSVESIGAVLDKSSKELKLALNETENEEAELRSHREKFILDIDAVLLTNYDKFRKARGGYGIISIARNACGSCCYSLPPQMVIEVKRRDKLIVCPSCGIHLFYDDTE